MTRNKKAVQSIIEKGVSAYETNNTVYIEVDGISFEIAEFEIEFQARDYDY